MFHCDDDGSKTCLTQLLSKDDFLESRSLKILEEDDIPGSVRIIGCFQMADEPQEALKILGLRNKGLDVSSWIVER